MAKKHEPIKEHRFCPYCDAEITEAVGENVGVAVVRGDSPGRKVRAEVRIRAYSS